MAMGNRPGVKTAPPPIVALDVTLLAQNLATAMARVPFRRPLEGDFSPAFRDPIRRYVERLREAGVHTKAQEFPGMFHVFQILMPWADSSRAAFRLVRSFIHEVVAGAPPLVNKNWYLD